MIELRNSGTLDIAIGKSRNEKAWKTKEYDWQEFVNKLSETYRTYETSAEYAKMKKSRQDEIKDIGGFVGGRIANGRRKAKNIVYRQLLTLDLDYAGEEWIDEVFDVFGRSAFCIYSTHKHTPKEPRYRLIMPLNRECDPAEYEAIARKVGEMLDIEAFDPTTFQPERLMYWPSTSKDGQYIFEWNDGKFLSADYILDKYFNWHDTSEWPVSSKISGLVSKSMKMQGDPLEKGGMLGAFCRTYTIHEGIELLNDISEQPVYEATDLEDRYTFLGGSTANGLVTYDDKFAYSHHGTDPTSGKLCNVFDLLRIHLYGDHDERASENTPVNRLPSYKLMRELASKDKQVLRQIGRERLEEATQAFNLDADDHEAEDLEDRDNEPQDRPNDRDRDTAIDRQYEDRYSDRSTDRDYSSSHKRDREAGVHDQLDVDWMEDLKLDSNGKDYLATIENVALILENDPNLKGCFQLNAFTRRKELARNVPWRRIEPEGPILQDEDKQNLHKYLEKYYGISGRPNIKDAIDTHFFAHSYHPVRDYLSALEWDEIPRIDTMLIDYLGAEDTEYVRMVTRKTLIAAVARIFRPGIKFEWVLTMIGPEGEGKSTLINKLGGPWFSDSFNFSMIHTKEGVEQLQGMWLIEIAELVGLKKSEVEAVKNFIGKRFDNQRMAYKENPLPYKRQCIFIGSTNDRNFLKGSTGNRRWWPVDILQQPAKYDPFKLQDDDEEIRQLWAEAKYYFDKGEVLYLPKNIEKIAREIQKEHLQVDDRAGIVQKYLDTLLPNNFKSMDMFSRVRYFKGFTDEEFNPGIDQRDKVCVAEIWCECFAGDPKTMTRQAVNDMHEIMKSMDGWKPFKSKTDFPGYGTQRGYYRERITGGHFLRRQAIENSKN